MLVLYHLSILLFGFWITRLLFPRHASALLVAISAVTLGLLVAIPITYLLAVLFRTTDPILWSTVMLTFGNFAVVWWNRKKLRHGSSLSVIDAVIVCVSFGVSWYIMMKSFKVGNDGTLLIARNAVFDFGHGLSIVRSMSWGSNIPYTSPFVAGTEHLYHFLFHFWVAIFEHFGVPIQLAMNIPSVVGFTLLLLTVYSLGKLWFGKIIVGILAVLLTVFHGGLMFIPFFQKYGISFSALWRNPNYLFAGPFDGSIFSLFFTLNVFVNQRQLGIGLAIFLLLYLLLLDKIKEKKLSSASLIIIGALIGCFSLWHIVLSIGLLFSFIVLLGIHKRWYAILLLSVPAISVSLIFIWQWIPSVVRALTSLSALGGSTGASHKSTLSWFIEFILLNFGLVIPLFCVGSFAARKIIKQILPLYILIGLFTAISIPSGIIDQKYLNIGLILIALFAAHGITVIWEWKTIGKVAILIAFPFVILSGIIDFMVIKNDYLFPFEQTLVSWIKHNTAPSAVFISYQDIFDPVTLAGRKNYYGFFKQPDIFLTNADKQRPQIVKDMYEKLNNPTQAQYLVVPLIERSNFTYDINIELMRKRFQIVYEDQDHIIFDVRKML